MKSYDEWLNWLARQSGGCYLSDLQFEPYRSQALKIMDTVDCPEQQRNYIIQYCSGRKKSNRQAQGIKFTA